MSPIRILIADDHSLFREGLAALLSSIPDTQVVGEAATGDEAISRAAELQPDVLLMDIQMPGLQRVSQRLTLGLVAAVPEVAMSVVLCDDFERIGSRPL